MDCCGIVIKYSLIMKRYVCCLKKAPQVIEPSRKFISSSKLISQPMPVTVEGCREYEAQLLEKRNDIDRKLKDIKNIIRSSIARNMTMQVTKYMDMGKEIKMQRDAIVKRLQEVRASSVAFINPLKD